jgi:hypothetical protein
MNTSDLTKKGKLSLSLSRPRMAKLKLVIEKSGELSSCERKLLLLFVSNNSNLMGLAVRVIAETEVERIFFLLKHFNCYTATSNSRVCV